MTISATYTPAQANGNDVAVAFPFTFKVFVEADLTVILTDALGVNTTQAITTDYTVSLNADQNNNPGGTVTMITAPATGETLIITRVLEELQETDIANGGGFYPEVLEDALDRLTMLNQQNTATTNRALVAPLAEASIDTLPSIADRASKYLAFDADGNPVAVAGTTNAFVVSAFAETLLDDGTAAAMRATIDVPSNTDLDLAKANTAGQFNNLGLSVTMAAGAVTVALKGADGNDPSAANPVTIAFRSDTATNGGSTAVEVTSATSVVIPSGAVIGTYDGLYSRIWVLGILNAGSVELAVINCVDTNNGGFQVVENLDRGDSGYLWDTIAIGVGADSWQVLYSNSARSNVPVVVLGCFDSQQATAGTWAAAASAVYVNPTFRPGRVVHESALYDSNMVTGTTTTPDDDTIPQRTEGTGFLAKVSQLGSASCPNLMVVDVEYNFACSAAVVVTLALFKGVSDPDAVAAAQLKVPAINTQCQIRLRHAEINNTTFGSVTFSSRLGPASAGTITVNGVSGARKMGGKMTSSIRITEISV